MEDEDHFKSTLYLVPMTVLITYIIFNRENTHIFIMGISYIVHIASGKHTRTQACTNELTYFEAPRHKITELLR